MSAPTVLNGPTKNHLRRDTWTANWNGHSFHEAYCGYATADPDRLDRPEWADRPTCRTCARMAVLS